MNEAKRLDGKPLVCQGVVVLVDGKEAIVETQWAQGIHKVFKLDDGRQIFDLDKLVASGRAQVCGERLKAEPAPETKKLWKS